MTTKPAPVLAAFDGSDDAVRALHWAVGLAEREGRPLRVVVVALDPEQVAPVMREYEADFAGSAAAMARDIVRHSHLRDPQVEVHHGWVLPVLHRIADGAGLVVVGSRGHGVVENHWLGSVSHHLAGHAPCDVAVVRAQHDPDSQRVLVGVDGSASSARALDRACVLAASTGGHVLAVHAYRDHRIRTDGLAVLPEDVDTAAADAAQRDAETFVAAAVRAHPDVPLRATAVVGRPAEVLARLSDDAALVVVGTRGRTTFAELLLGSVAQETLYRAECPVLVVR
jgi:nucleotide-binding universal stress UspA family protein